MFGASNFRAMGSPVVLAQASYGPAPGAGPATVQPPVAAAPPPVAAPAPSAPASAAPSPAPVAVAGPDNTVPIVLGAVAGLSLLGVLLFSK